MIQSAKELLLIFTRNPELGKCKTRLAAHIGDEAALDIYKFLLNHTVTITSNLAVEKWIYYSEEIWEDDIWDPRVFSKKLQYGKELGERMANAFREGLNAGFEKIIIIGSDMFDLSQQDLEKAFALLDQADLVIGPAKDGGYYLLGMKQEHPGIFRKKQWGGPTVLDDTLADLKDRHVRLLAVRNDIDVYDDIKDHMAFKPFLKHD